MLTKYHTQITRKALGEYFSMIALNEVIRANVKQDGLFNQIGHDQLHFDNNKFTESMSYINDQRDRLFCNLNEHKPFLARQNFGRLTHTCQDLYAHSNYVSLWLAGFDPSRFPSPEIIDPCDEMILSNPDLKSGRLYYPFEVLSFIPILNILISPLLPGDSHARMNLDSPAGGDLFPYAFSAAVKRTVFEFEIITSEMSKDLIALFVGEET